jgi:hypothetical protein
LGINPQKKEKISSRIISFVLSACSTAETMCELCQDVLQQPVPQCTRQHIQWLHEILLSGGDIEKVADEGSVKVHGSTLADAGERQTHHGWTWRLWKKRIYILSAW